MSASSGDVALEQTGHGGEPGFREADHRIGCDRCGRVSDGPADPRAAGLEDGPDGGLHPDEVGSAGVARIHQDADELPAGLRGRVGAVEPAEYGRLSLRGNRRLNHAIHMAAITQIRHRHSVGRACYDKKIADGKTRKEALRSLKRRISNASHSRCIVMMSTGCRRP